jgi:hypothetical protein
MLALLVTQNVENLHKWPENITVFSKVNMCGANYVR